MTRLFALATMLLTGLLAALPAAAQTWPIKPVKVVVGFPAGTSADIIARIYAERLADHFKQPFVVENMPGAASSRAAGVVAAAEPDGYTIFLGTAANTISQSVYKKLKFDFGVDFAGIATLGIAPTVLVVSPALGISTVKELIELAKSKPDGVFYATAGVGTTPHLAAEMFNQLAGVKLIHVPYKGNNEAMNDLLGGRIHVNFAPIPTVAGLITAGQVKGVAVGSAKRSSLAPQLPTLAEAGVAGFDAAIWYGFLAPKATPRPAMEAMADVIKRAWDSPEVKAKLATNGADPLALELDTFTAFVRDDVAKWRRIVETAGVSVE
jgi:tripartite-type tricarboxylate transporter receptor subunit TctC